jgi:hypothetical protein
VAVTVSTFTDPLGGLFGNFFTGEFLGTVTNRFGCVFPVRPMTCGLSGKGVGNLVQYHLL